MNTDAVGSFGQRGSLTARSDDRRKNANSCRKTAASADTLMGFRPGLPDNHFRAT